MTLAPGKRSSKRHSKVVSLTDRVDPGSRGVNYFHPFMWIGDHRLWPSRTHSCHLPRTRQPRSCPLRGFHGQWLCGWRTADYYHRWCVLPFIFFPFLFLFPSPFLPSLPTNPSPLDPPPPTLNTFTCSRKLPRLPHRNPRPRADGQLPLPVPQVRHDHHHRNHLQTRPLLPSVPVLARNAGGKAYFS
jgi:hypothetical protein